MLGKLLSMKRTVFIVLPVFLVFFGCNDTDKVAEEIAKIPVEVNISRFDREFANAKPADLATLKSTYPYLFPAQYHDTIWEAKLKDTIQIELFNEVGKSFPDFENEQQELTELFQHIKYYFPKFQSTKRSKRKI